ncbi:Rieske 2Fe-2S domain-containing protein [Temperatibacter marinus]|uniref:Rieske 2Fe-2S domain-containing protein n=1 Tax=Temperatibacter marinus TaxID=1456591 RepID=A0AA52EKM7_9PROT|nr:Rieske 2Fe-2S domain-containing protein [Temperatibacter marinus]WND03746.1 Rieske 2Fe-2S domain-containing protein [Temperatibacter marinus]
MKSGAVSQAPSPAYLADYPAGPAVGTLMATLSDLQKTGSKNVIFKKEDKQLQVLLHCTVKGIKAYINSCPHARVPLNLFGDRFMDITDRYLLCQTHGARFEPETGYCIAGPCKGEYLRSVAIKVTEKAIYSA